MGPAGDPTTRLYLLFHGYTSTLWERMKWPAKTATRYRTRCRRATTTRRHWWRAVRGAFYMPPRLTARLHRFHGRYGYRAGVGGRRAVQWQEHSPGNLRLSGCSWKCFARYWYSGLTTKCLVNTKKSSPPRFSGWMKNIVDSTGDIGAF